MKFLQAVRDSKAVCRSVQEFFKATDPLLPSGLLGPVQILPAELIESPNTAFKKQQLNTSL